MQTVKLLKTEIQTNIFAIAPPMIAAPLLIVCPVPYLIALAHQLEDSNA
jgi:hypothetical protein